MDSNVEPNNTTTKTSQISYMVAIWICVHQEIMLGIGGVQMLKALGLRVTAYHMNEGHAAFSRAHPHIIQEEG